MKQLTHTKERGAQLLQHGPKYEVILSLHVVALHFIVGILCLSRYFV